MVSSFASSDSDPVVGGSVLSVNVDIVATTGYRASKLLGSNIFNDQGEMIGILKDFTIGPNAKVSIAIIGVGGLRYRSQKFRCAGYAVQNNELGQTVLPGANKNLLSDLPGFRFVEYCGHNLNKGVGHGK